MAGCETRIRDGFEGRLLSMVGPEQLRRILEPMLRSESSRRRTACDQCRAAIISHQTGWTGLVAACLLYRPDPIE